MWADWIRSPHRHFYVGEIAQLWAGNCVIPLRWVIRHSKEHTEVIFLDEILPGEYQLQDPEKGYIPCTDLSRNFLDLKSIYPQLMVHGEWK